jgi:hypothetical protein
MGSFEYLLLFAAVILGLAVSELAVNLNRLMRAKARVRWDWLAPLAALVAFLKIVTQWWVWFRAESIATALTFEMYLAVLIEAVLLFLLAAAALPDAVPEQGLDLRQSYKNACRRFWLLFAAQWLLWNAVGLWIQLRIEGAHVSLLQPSFLALPVVLVTAFVRSRWLHTVVLLGFVFLYVWLFYGTTLARRVQPPKVKAYIRRPASLARSVTVPSRNAPAAAMS